VLNGFFIWRFSLGFGWFGFWLCGLCTYLAVDVDLCVHPGGLERGHHHAQRTDKHTRKPNCVYIHRAVYSCELEGKRRIGDRNVHLRDKLDGM